MTHRAPCGHVGEVVIGAFTLCLAGCDGKPRACGRCGSPRIEPFAGHGVPLGSLRCVPCGWVGWSPHWRG